jgi:hypothetical protein
VAEDAGALSPYGEIEFPVPVDQIPYVHPYTVPQEKKTIVIPWVVANDSG